MTSKQPELEIDLERLQIRRGEKRISLTPIEWDLLRVFVQHKNETLSHKFLLKAVWGDTYGVESTYLYAYIGQLRKNLAISEGDRQYILTVPKLGYQWVEQENTETSVRSPSTGQPNLYSTLPAPLTSFIGRERELSLLEGMLRKRDIRLITLSGPGGIGKTRLSLETARTLAGEAFFADGIHFISLETVDAADFVVSAVAHIFGIREKAGEDLLSSLKNYLFDKHLLLILDNFEHVHAAATHVLELLKAAARLKILVTSRESLNLYGEQNFEVPPLSRESHPVSIEEATPALSEAAQLFVERAQRLNPYFEITPENAEIVQQICDRLDGLPLAIELAAVQSKRFTLQELLNRLESRLTVLIGGQTNLPPRHQTLQAAIDWSYQLLDARERKLFVSLSVFSGSFTTTAVDAIYLHPSQHQRPVTQILLSLQNKSLLSSHWDEHHGETRYTMLGVFREYASQLLDEGDAEALSRRHAAYYVGLLEQSTYTPAENSYERLSLDLGNLRAALRWATTHGNGEVALRLAVGMHELWLRLGILREGKQRLFEVLDATENESSVLRARALYSAGVISDWLGEPLKAQGVYRESLRLYEMLGDRSGLASALLTLASALINQGDYSEGYSLSEQALNMARESNNAPGAALALNNLGMIAIYQGEARKAQDIYEETLSLWRAMNVGQGMGWANTGLSWVALLQGDFEGAQDFINQSLAYHQQAADMLGATLALTCDSWIALYQADFLTASNKLASCLQLCQQLGLVGLSVWPLVGLGLIDFHRGDAAQAERLFEEALDICKLLNFPPMTTWVYIALGRLFRVRGKTETAFDWLDRALMLSHRRDDKSALITTLEEFAAYFADQQQFEAALQLLDSADAMREGYHLPLPKIDRIQQDKVKALIQSDKNLDWDGQWHNGRSLTWDEITRLIYPRGWRISEGESD